MVDISKIVANISTNPGVYSFKDKKGDIIYIGKAKNLKKRVSSYFNKSNNNSKNQIMISKAVDVDTLIVRNEVEALLTEANLIKIHKPRYNVFLKDDKTFPYIIITNEPFPRVEIIRKKNLKKDGNLYFGPYTDVNYLRSILKVLHQVFPLRTCSFFINEETIKSRKIKVCLDYHIKKCDGPCEGLVSDLDYGKMINQVIDFLKGKNQKIKLDITSRMKDASQKQKYEEAAILRDQIIALDSFEKKQSKVAQDFSNKDIINISYKDNYAIAFIMRIRNGLLVGRDSFNLKMIHNFNINDELEKFIVQYYKLTMDIPSEIIVGYKIYNTKNIEKWLKTKNSKKVSIVMPLKGEKKHMLDLCIKNNELFLKNSIIKKINRKEYVPKTLSQLKDDLNMSVIPKRIEAFDNSNIQGEQAVAGVVCFLDGKPQKKEYRHFNIKTVKGIDDFESMREVVYRRYSRQLEENKILPDLILIDGGKGQLSAAKSSLDKLGLGYITIIGLAKKLEEVYVPGLSQPQNINKTSPGLYLLRIIRDEVHRYAVSFHRKKRKNNMLQSNLSKVKGLGLKRIKLLWDNYNTIDEMLSASDNEIYKKTGIPKEVIKTLKNTKDLK
tara:strand:- start:47 stop:1873 length:1827 start_codon:yes stop_codon:yes gene_type:complete